MSTLAPFSYARLASLAIALAAILASASAASCPSGSRIITSGNLRTEVNNTPTGGILCLNGGSYSLGSTVTVGKAMKIVGVGYPSITQTFSGWMFNVTASNVTIKGLKMTGANRNRTGEGCSGTGAIQFNAVGNANVLDNIADNFTCGIHLDGTSGFTISGNKLSNVKLGGIYANAVSNGTVDRNTVINVDHDGPLGQNAYGIVMTTSGSAVSANVIVTYNYVENAPTWECYDTHDGQSIYWYSNVCIAPGKVGINSRNSGVREVSDVHNKGNIIHSGGLTSQWHSITLTGTGTIVNNTILNFSGGDCAFDGPNAAISGNTCTSGSADVIPPSVPTGLSATAGSSSQINLSWNTSTDNVSVTGYDVYRNGSLVASVTSTTYNDSGLAGNTTYSYEVRSRDAAGNVSVARTLAVFETTAH